MDLRTVSGLARPLDFSFTTNRWIAAIAAAVLLGATILRGLLTGAWPAAAGWGALAALSVFLAWALGRELDPDHDPAAFVAVALSLVGIVAMGLPDIAALFVVLLAVRVLNRTTGVPATLVDGLGLLGLGLWLASGGAWLGLAIGAAALVLDGLLRPTSQQRFLLGLLGAAVAFGVALLIAAEPDLSLAPLAILVAAVGGIVFSIAIRGAAQTQTRTDVTDEPLSATRVRAGQLLALAAGLGSAVLEGFSGLTALMPLWAAMLAAGAYRMAPRRVA